MGEPKTLPSQDLYLSFEHPLAVAHSGARREREKIVGAGFLPDRPEATKTAPGFWARFLELYQREAREANR